MSESLPETRSAAHHGVSLIYTTMALIVLLGFCSLAVDLGRVQSAKTELERACDAAARAGAANLPNGVTSVQSAAAAMALNNLADGTPVVINSGNNVVFLNWPSTTPLTGAARSSANAVRVTAQRSVSLLFAQALGIQTASIHGTSTALAAPPGPGNYQVVGLSAINFNSGNYLDSYNSANGSYASQSPGNQGSIASNGTITVYSGSTINGNVYYNGSTVPSISSVGGVCTGSIVHITNSIAYPLAAAPAGSTSLGNLSVNAGTTTLTAGNYTCTGGSINSGGTLNINATAGPVNLYCSGTFSGNGGTILTYGNIPNNFHLYMTNASAVTLNSGSYWYGVIYAPLSTVSLTSTAALYGSVISQTLTVDSGTAIHFDTALGSNGGGGGAPVISQVQ